MAEPTRTRLQGTQCHHSLATMAGRQIVLLRRYAQLPPAVCGWEAVNGRLPVKSGMGKHVAGNVEFYNRVQWRSDSASTSAATPVAADREIASQNKYASSRLVTCRRRSHVWPVQSP